jgi:hypothetical protein
LLQIPGFLGTSAFYPGRLDAFRPIPSKPAEILDFIFHPAESMRHACYTSSFLVPPKTLGGTPSESTAPSAGQWRKDQHRGRRGDLQ